MGNTSTFYIGTGEQRKSGGRAVELAVFAVLLAAMNVSLLRGAPPEPLVYNAEAIKAGQLWRIVTHPFAHVSGYHLFMDASAFLMLYAGLEEKRILKRLSYVVACGAGSLFFSLLCSRVIGSIGLCGLSGIAHGLMAVTSMDLLKNQKKGTVLFGAGSTLLAIIILKGIAEVWTGSVIFSNLHMGSVGIPVVEAHLGGVMGGLGSFIIFNKIIGK